MRGSGRRQKGNAFENKVAKILSPYFKVTLRRTPGSGGWSRVSNKGDLTAEKGTPFDFCIECKHDKNWSLDDFVLNGTSSKLGKFLEQTVREAAVEEKIPILVAQRNYKKPLIFFRLRDFEKSLPLLRCVIRFGGSRWAVMKLDTFVLHSPNTKPKHRK